MIRVKRVYDPPARSDGTRVLVDRLWPRGLSKAKAAIDLWLKDIAPSTKLRLWYAHEEKKWPEFRRRYAAELNDHKEATKDLRARAKRGTLTLLFSSRELERNNAVALKKYLER